MYIKRTPLWKSSQLGTLNLAAGNVSAVGQSKSEQDFEELDASWVETFFVLSKPFHLL